MNAGADASTDAAGLVVEVFLYPNDVYSMTPAQWIVSGLGMHSTQSQIRCTVVIKRISCFLFLFEMLIYIIVVWMIVYGGLSGGFRHHHIDRGSELIRWIDPAIVSC